MIKIELIRLIKSKWQILISLMKFFQDNLFLAREKRHSRCRQGPGKWPGFTSGCALATDSTV